MPEGAREDLSPRTQGPESHACPGVACLLSVSFPLPVAHTRGPQSVVFSAASPAPGIVAVGRYLLNV